MDKEADDEDWEEDDRVGKGEEEERDEKSPEEKEEKTWIVLCC